MKDNHFKLSASFTSLFSSKQSSAHPKQQPSKSADKALFKLNPKLAYTLDDVPVELLKKNSKSKLQSLKDDKTKDKWSIFAQKMDPKEAIKEKKVMPKKYLLDMNIEGGKKQNESAVVGKQELPYDIVQPSRLEHLKGNASSQSNCSLFQTPLLPCFASQFRQAAGSVEFKSVQQKQGVWKIGKIKIKGKTAKLTIGGIEFQAVRADVSGKAGVVSGDSFIELPNWKHIWVVQPSPSLFA